MTVPLTLPCASRHAELRRQAVAARRDAGVLRRRAQETVWRVQGAAERRWAAGELLKIELREAAARSNEMLFLLGRCRRQVAERVTAASRMAAGPASDCNSFE